MLFIISPAITPQATSLLQGSVFSVLIALTVHEVHPVNLKDVEWQLFPALRMLDLRYDQLYQLREFWTPQVIQDV